MEIIENNYGNDNKSKWLVFISILIVLRYYIISYNNFIKKMTIKDDDFYFY